MGGERVGGGGGGGGFVKFTVFGPGRTVRWCPFVDRVAQSCGVQEEPSEQVTMAI